MRTQGTYPYRQMMNQLMLLSCMLFAMPGATAFAHGPAAVHCPPVCQAVGSEPVIESGENSDKTTAELNGCLQRYIARFEIPGAAVAIVKDGQVIYQASFGLSNLEHQRPVSDGTAFSLYSVTKLFVATGVFQLIENGKLSLDDSVSKHLDGLPESWHAVTIRNLLTHSSGLPAIAPYAHLPEAEARTKVFGDAIQFQSGDRFRYTQTNYWLINRIIAKLSDQKLEEFIARKQFTGAKRDSVLFIDNNVDRLDVRAKSYLPDKHGKLMPSTFEGPEFLLGAGGLNLTLAEFIKWNQRLDENVLVTATTKKQMWEPFEFRKEKFPMANGWGIYSLAKRKSYGFTGGGRVGFRKFPQNDLTVILLTNGYRHRFSADTIINRLTGIVDSGLQEVPPLIDEAMFANFNDKNLEDAIATYYELVSSFDSVAVEQPMNMLGYEFLNRKKINVALAIFKLNADQHPNSWNAWDSLAECQATAGIVKTAISNYKKSVELNPDNEGAKAAIVRLSK